MDARSIRVELEPCFIGPPTVVAAPGDRLILSSPSPGTLYWLRPDWLDADWHLYDQSSKLDVLELSGNDERVIELPTLEHHRLRGWFASSLLQPEVHDRIIRVVVQRSRLWALTDARGRFEIEGLEPGTYEIQFWHPWIRGRRRRATVTDAVLRIDHVVAVLDPPQRRRLEDAVP